MFSQTSEETAGKMVELSDPKYTYTKRGVFYFSKKIPTDLRHHNKKPIITQSLRTKSKMAAEKALIVCNLYFGADQKSLKRKL